MISTIVRHGDVTVTLRRETRGTALKRSRYLRYVAESRDDLKTFVTYTNMMLFSVRAASGEIAFDDGTAFRMLSDFATILSQVVSTENAPFVVKSEAEYLTKEKVLEAWANYEDDDTELWDALINAIYELSEPSTPPDQMPSDKLSEAEKKDPNS